MSSTHTTDRIRALEREMLAHGDEAPWSRFVDADGEQDLCGVIVKKRMVDATTVFLTYSKANHIWWIAWIAKGMVGF